MQSRIVPSQAMGVIGGWAIAHPDFGIIVHAFCFISNGPTILLYYVLLIKQNE